MVAGHGEQSASHHASGFSIQNAGEASVTYASVLQTHSREQEPTHDMSGRGGGGFQGLNPKAAEFRPTSSGAGNNTNIGDNRKLLEPLRNNPTWRGEIPSKSNKKCKSQARRDRWLALNKSNKLKKKYRAFNKGAKKFYSKLKATHEDLRQASNYTQNDGIGLGIGRADREMVGKQAGEQAETDRREMQGLLEYLSDDGVGYLSSRKRKGMVRNHV